MGNPIRKLAGLCGYDLVRKKSGFQDEYNSGIDGELESMIQTVRDNTMLARPGLLSLYHQVLFCEQRGLEGDFVECGVWKGGAVGLMAQVNLKHGKTRRNLHLFDSYEEICEPDEDVDGDRAINEAKAWSKSGGSKGNLTPLTGFYDHMGGPGTIENNRQLLIDKIGYPEKNIHFHKGWFQDTLPKDADQIDKIALLRLDADWFASTKICIDYLFDKVVNGGFVIFDDYGTYEGCQKAVDEFLASNDKPLFLNYVTQDIRYIVVT